jgi:hypothetical protein
LSGAPDNFNMKISKREIYKALFKYCAASKRPNNSFYLATAYDDTHEFLEFIAKEVKADNMLKVLNAVKRAKTTLIENGWLYRYNSVANKQYIGEPAYIVNYYFVEADIKRYMRYTESGEAEKFFDSIPI